MSIQAVGWAIGQPVGSSAQKLTLIAIANYADEKGEAWPSQQRLCRDTDLSESSIKRCLMALEQRGIISRTKRKRPDGSHASDLIKINQMWGSTQTGDGSTVNPPPFTVDGGTGSQLPGEGATVNPLYEPSLEPSIGTVKEERTRASALVPSHAHRPFDVFWEAYPHKVGKEAARKAWEKARGKIEFTQLMAALQRYREKQDDRPWCNPATWLNQERWLDVPAPPVVPQPRQLTPFEAEKADLRAAIEQLERRRRDDSDLDGEILSDSPGVRCENIRDAIGRATEALPQLRLVDGPLRRGSG
jgi:hypothetical protein